MVATSTSAGPWGGPGGKEWSYNPTGRICKIILIYKQAVYAIRFCDDNDGECIWSETFGDDASRGDTTMISIGDSVEQLTSINGTCGSLYKGGPRMITSLTFTSNLSRYGPYGRESGTSFCFCCPLDAGIVTGFHGRSGEYLYAIGVSITPLEIGIDQISRKAEADGETVASTIENRDESSKRKMQQKMEVHVTDTRLEEMKNLVHLFEGKISAIEKPKLFVDLTLDGEEINSRTPDFDRTFVSAKQASGKSSPRLKRAKFTELSRTSPVSAIKSKIKTIVDAGFGKFSSYEVSALESLSLQLEKQPGCSEGDRVFVMKLKNANGLMKEVERLGELTKMLEVQKVEYRQEYARIDEYFTFLKKSIDIMVEVKNDEKLLQHGLYSSNVRVPFEFFNSSMSILIIKLNEKSVEMKRLQGQVDELKTKKKFAIELLESCL